MADLRHKTGLYFGLVERRPGDPAPAPSSWRRWTLRMLFVLVVGSAMVGLLDGSFWHGARFGVLMVVMLTGFEIHRRWTARRATQAQPEPGQTGDRPS